MSCLSLARNRWSEGKPVGLVVYLNNFDAKKKLENERAETLSYINITDTMGQVY